MTFLVLKTNPLQSPTRRKQANKTNEQFFNNLSTFHYRSYAIIMIFSMVMSCYFENLSREIFFFICLIIGM
jgi:hypothetical protein